GTGGDSALRFRKSFRQRQRASHHDGKRPGKTLKQQERRQRRRVSVCSRGSYVNSKMITLPTPPAAPDYWLADDDLCACFGALYARLLPRLPADRPTRIVGISGCHRDSGVSTVAGGLAAAAAKECSGRVLLIDASGHAEAAAESVPGLVDLLVGSCGPDQALQPGPMENLWMLPAGGPAPVGFDIAAASLSELIRGLSLDFSFIVVDMAPVDELAGGLDVTAAVDGIVLVLEAGLTTRDQARTAQLRLWRQRLLGTVLNKCEVIY
ncbi:MAG TPA: hypothetical protein VGG30_09680, partial [Pirellulales bacterium]